MSVGASTLERVSTCTIEGCAKPVQARGWCCNHYALWLKNGDPLLKRGRWDGHIKTTHACDAPGCERQVYKRRLCAMHSMRLHRRGDVSISLPHRRRYQFRQDLFDTWTPASAWVLGWALSDGCVNAKAPGLFFGLKDEQATRLLSKAMGHPAEPRIHKGKFHVGYHSRHMADRLVELGITPAKSLTVQMPPVPDEVLSHFVRGAIEGDGSLTPAHAYPRVSMNSASEAMIHTFAERVPFRGSLFVTGVTTRLNPLWRVVYSGPEAKRMAAWMYTDSDGMRLDRKYDRFLGWA